MDDRQDRIRGDSEKVAQGRRKDRCRHHGGDGVEAYAPGFAIHQPAVKVTVADTVGAGDTFTAGLLAALSRAKLLNKKKLEGITEPQLAAALAFAAKAAAVTVSRPGADPPWAHEVA